MIHFTHYKTGEAFGILYIFTDAGDEIAQHRHRKEDLHNIMVMKGAVALLIENEGTLFAIAGELLDFDGSKPHTVRAIEPDTRTFHLYLHGEPADYVDLRPDERAGSVCGTSQKI